MPFPRLPENAVISKPDYNSKPLVISGKQDVGVMQHWDALVLMTWRNKQVINAGKSSLNEDQACCGVVCVEKGTSKEHSSTLKAREDEANGVLFHFWALFDGHAGTGAAIMASKLLHVHICDQLQEIMELLLNPTVAPSIILGEEARPLTSEPRKTSSPEEGGGAQPVERFHQEKAVSLESLVIGAIENAFKQMDKQIERERSLHSITGGCCALTVLHMVGKLYVANAGDSRAIIIRNQEVIPMSSEFTPETERQRLQYLGFLKPELLGNEFTHIEFPRRIQHKELGKKMLFRDHTMTGWAYKTIEEEDLKFPLIYGEGKRARLMATIGVTRGLGDHDLKVYSSNIHIKPFLSCCPEVQVYDVTQYQHSPDDVLVLGSDGLWDVTTDREVADAVSSFLSQFEPNDPMRYSLAAQDLVMRSRGVLKDRGWRLANDKLGSGDDITVFVIPLASQCRES
ncbi:Protein phosphatase 1H [Acipenser ruthenus]|uniref:Protein phosphatase 1H n=1 Tax=Acipenser ruthenus TaxID=7906 RepID=A0A444V637_ACIRT|nr:Protein phosphatase 1H [Acipenser ruthenus]